MAIYNGDKLIAIDETHLEKLIKKNSVGRQNGVAGLDENGRVPMTQLPSTLGGGGSPLMNSLIATDGGFALDARQGRVLNEIKVNVSEVGKPNGIASLDENGKVPLAQLPNIGSEDNLEELEGEWIHEWMGGFTMQAGVFTINRSFPIEEFAIDYAIVVGGDYGNFMPRRIMIDVPTQLLVALPPQPGVVQHQFSVPFGSGSVNAGQINVMLNYAFIPNNSGEPWFPPQLHTIFASFEIVSLANNRTMYLTDIRRRIL